MAPFKYGMVVDGENYCPRTELARQSSKLIEAGLNVVVQGERRIGKTSSSSAAFETGCTIYSIRRKVRFSSLQLRSAWER